MTYPFHYEVIVLDPTNQTPKHFRESGMGFCENYTEAMNHIENFYGDDLIAVKHLELLEENNLIILPKQYINDYVKDDFPFPTIIPCDINGKPYYREEC